MKNIGKLSGTIEIKNFHCFYNYETWEKLLRVLHFNLIKKSFQIGLTFSKPFHFFLIILAITVML